MGRSRSYHLLGYGPAIRGSRHVYSAMSLLESYQETVKAARSGSPIPVEWTYQTETGRRMLGLAEGEFYRKADDMATPPGLVSCPRCLGKSCQVCGWSGETTRRVLAGYKAWQLEPLEAE